MGLTRELMLERMLQSDAGYDGRFITGVRTTGIYCLPSCRARKPRPDNVDFYPRPEDALAAGFRPCKRCRPDNFYRDHDPDRERLEEIVRQQRDGVGVCANVAELAAAVGVGGSKLHELFRRHYHTTPADLLGQSRIDRAAAALLSSRTAITDIAFDAGYETLSAFHDGFRRRMRMPPSDYRKLTAASEFTLTLPRWFLRQRVLDYIGRDAESTSERADASGFAFVTRVDHTPVIARVELAKEHAHCRLATNGKLPPSSAVVVHRQLLKVLGLHLDPGPYERRVLAAPELAPLIAGRHGLTIPQTRDLFEGLIWVVVGQQVSLDVAMSMRRKLTARVGQPVADGLCALPEPAAIAKLELGELRSLGFSQRKGEYVLDIARAVDAGALDLDAVAQQSATRVERTLMDVRGLGIWSVQYLMMRALGFADCVPIGDVALARSLMEFFQLDSRPGPERTHELLAPLAPYRSLATFHFWSRLKEKPQ